MRILARKAQSAVYRLRRQIHSQRFGFSPQGIYEQEFYTDGGFSKTEASAEAIADWVGEHLAPRSVLDLGSGSGHYLLEFKKRGLDVVGFEASPVGVSNTGADALAISYDLKSPLHLSRRFELGMCVEVAEHIPKRCSGTLVSSLCRNAKRHVLFTAAPPGTPGTDHINCQPEEFWFRLFEKENFRPNRELTESLRHHATQCDTAEWWKGWSFCLERGR